MPVVMEAIDKMTTEEKVEVMNYLWGAIAASGEQFVPVWHVVDSRNAVTPPRKRVSQYGVLKGKVMMSSDLDAPLEDFASICDAIPSRHPCHPMVCRCRAGSNPLVILMPFFQNTGWCVHELAAARHRDRCLRQSGDPHPAAQSLVNRLQHLDPRHERAGARPSRMGSRLPGGGRVLARTRASEKSRKDFATFGLRICTIIWYTVRQTHKKAREKSIP